MYTTSTSGSSITACQCAWARANPNDARASSKRSGTGSLHATSTGS